MSPLVLFMTSYFVLAAVAWFGLGALWYSPLLFGRTWQRHMGISADAGSMKKVMVSHLLSTLLMLLPAFGVLGVAFGSFPGATYALLGAAIVWAVFVLPFAVGDNLYAKRAWALVWIEVSFKLVYFLALALAYAAALAIVS